MQSRHSNHLLRAGNRRARCSRPGSIPGLTLGAETKRGQYGVDIGLSAPLYTWARIRRRPSCPIDPSFSANGSYRGQALYAGGHVSDFDIQPTTFTQFEDTGILSDRTAQLTVDYSVDFTYEVDRLNSLTVSTAGGLVEFLTGRTGAGLDPDLLGGGRLEAARWMNARASASISIWSISRRRMSLRPAARRSA